MTLIKVNGITNWTKFLFFINCVLLFSGCRSIKQEVINHNYFQGVKNKGDIFYNDSIDISIDFSKNTIYEDLTKIRISKLKSELTGIRDVCLDNLIVASKTNEVKSYYFFEKVQFPSDTLLHERIIREDKEKGISIGEKQKGTKKIICVTKSFISRDSVSIMNSENLKKVYLDSSNLKNITTLHIFNYYVNGNRNFLQGRDKLKKAPIKDPKKNMWKDVFIMTFNSFMSNNSEYKELIRDHESKKDHFEKTLQNGLSLEGVKKDDSVFAYISELAKNNQVIMLNEDHFYPKHRLFAMQLLDVLKQNGFTYISIEAFTETPNEIVVPNSKNGLYTKEPYFGHFIRKANKMGFNIVGHESYDNNIDREIGQARNILKILEKDPKAKIFVYAGHGHIEEGGKRRLMASYFKEFSKINPITINQEKIVDKTKESLVLIPRSVFEKDTLMHSSADYFLINNQEAKLTNVYPDKTFKTVFLRNSEFLNYKKEELLLEVYSGEEYEKTKSASLLVPIAALLIKPKGSRVEFSLPVGKYYIEVKSIDNHVFKFDGFKVK
ncbi:hypothetical protein ABXT06_05125 [Flavobacterium sp. UW10123]|uniref:hypothetical protein n=1 Tax=Flavobacterium sp. UW10123 TaxID=3230800 RepID=UPI003392FBC6